MSDELISHYRLFSRSAGLSTVFPSPSIGDTGYQKAKAFAGRAAAGILLVILSPLILFCGVLVRLTSTGPSFYTQVRLGHRGRPFRIYKVRTMRFRCEANTGAVWATAKDPRVTPVGRILRRLHLDELPQLWNIFLGDMCFIGPRPERPEIVEKLVLDLPNFNERLVTKPGLTGLSQVLQMADTSLESARTKLWNDLDYIRRESVWLDTRILLGTAMIILGVKRPGVARILALNWKPGRPKSPSPATECIFEAPVDLPKLCDSGILGAL